MLNTTRFLRATNQVLAKKLPSSTSIPVRHLNIPGVKKLDTHIPEAHYYPDQLPPVEEWRFKKAFDPIQTKDGRTIQFQPLPEDQRYLAAVPDATVEDLYYFRQAEWISKHRAIDDTEYGKFEIKYVLFFFGALGGLFGFGYYENEHRKHEPFPVPNDDYYRSRQKERGAGWFPVPTCQLFEFSCFRRGLDKADVLMRQLEAEKNGTPLDHHHH